MAVNFSLCVICFSFLTALPQDRLEGNCILQQKGDLRVRNQHHRLAWPPGHLGTDYLFIAFKYWKSKITSEIWAALPLWLKQAKLPWSQTALSHLRRIAHVRRFPEHIGRDGDLYDNALTIMMEMMRMGLILMEMMRRVGSKAGCSKAPFSSRTPLRTFCLVGGARTRNRLIGTGLQQQCFITSLAKVE